ncbi:MAG TPA: metalloregulator ArsR/SmtB family transcription factor [Intrasporangium sp.]|uniref:ArsR/SmtB family transcription factor n=1 Tax=Intrasporangium sp. TaxID=1925024 RepID=UPI002B483BE5|nr:metalloregulator ArsR/SmtB family transcription factor [Intrasporangium sp.]HKX66811.1 metalloregulator ArsR/SmtB family transcription factor [Intrasporangium sp.]
MATSTAPSTVKPLTVLSACCAPAAAVPDESARELAAMFKALADPARIKIMSMLLNADEVCACDFSSGIGKSAATTSHHLKLLREAGLVTSDRRGTWVYYRAVPERLSSVRDALVLGH